MMAGSQKRKSPVGAGLGIRRTNISDLNSSTPIDPGYKFAAFAESLDFRVEYIAPDGCVHRFPAPGDRHGARNGWAVLHGGAFPVGILGSWKTGETHKWRLRSDIPTIEERTQLDEAMREAQWQRDEQTELGVRSAKEKAARMWKSAHDADTSHPYLISKNSRPEGIRQLGNMLLIPMRDTTGTMIALQTIDASGNKRFLSGARKRGLYHGVGGPLVDVVAIVEGYATGISVHDATGHPVAIAFDAGNLKSVAQALRSKYPNINIVICADDDRATEEKIGRNPGRYYADLAAQAVGGSVAVPEFAA